MGRSSSNRSIHQKPVTPLPIAKQDNILWGIIWKETINKTPSTIRTTILCAYPARNPAFGKQAFCKISWRKIRWIHKKQPNLSCMDTVYAKSSTRKQRHQTPTNPRKDRQFWLITSKNTPCWQPTPFSPNFGSSIPSPFFTYSTYEQNCRYGSSTTNSWAITITGKPNWITSIIINNARRIHWRTTQYHFTTKQPYSETTTTICTTSDIPSRWTDYIYASDEECGCRIMDKGNGWRDGKFEEEWYLGRGGITTRKKDCRQQMGFQSKAKSIWLSGTVQGTSSGKRLSTTVRNRLRWDIRTGSTIWLLSATYCNRFLL